MEDLIKGIEKIYNNSGNQVALIDLNARVIWCNDVPISRLEKLKVGMDLSQVAVSVFWSQAEYRLRRGICVQLTAVVNGQTNYLYIEPFIAGDGFVYSLVHFTNPQSVYDLATARIIHDVRNPINVMLMLSEKMSEKDRETVRHYCRATLGILDELEIHSAKGETEVRTENVNMTEFIGRLFKECEVALIKNYKVEVQITDKALVCNANAKEIETAVVNLIMNAKNHCDSHIKLELYEKDGSAVIAVENDGDKVDESIRDTMYEPCVKANSSGSGLGLYSVKTVADKHNGNVTYIPGENTRFELSIPLALAVQVKSLDDYPEINTDYIKYVLERKDG